MATRHALIFIGGYPPDPRALAHVTDHHLVVCADSGLQHALALGARPSVVVGDMDSVDPGSLDRAVADGVATVIAPSDKDLTDTEIAIAHALSDGADALTVLWGGGDRVDHSLGVFAACSDPRLDSLDFVDLWVGADLVRIARPHRPVEIEGAPGSTVSLLPLGGSAEGVRTEGLRWPLSDDTLRSDSARGVSNVLIDRRALIRLATGTLAVIVPSRATGGLTAAEVSS